MRILHVTDTYLPRLGGIELHVSDLATRQAARGDDVLVLTAEAAARTTRDAGSHAGSHAGSDAVPVVRMRGGVLNAGVATELGPLVARFAPDVVHAHLSVGSPFTWSVLRGSAGIPVLATVHSLLPSFPWLLRTSMKVIGLPADRITFSAVSNAAAEPVRQALGPGRSVHVLPNGIDPAQWTVAHRRAEAVRILAVGRMAARKRPLLLVEALAELAHRDPELEWSATLVGDGAQRARVATAIRAHGLGNRVRLLGVVDRGRIRELLGQSDVFVAPAALESFGIAALEARCAGVPVVAMASSGVTEFIQDGVNGLLARSDDDLARCLRDLARDRSLRTAMRRHSTHAPVDVSWERVLDRHTELYARVAALQAGARATVQS